MKALVVDDYDHIRGKLIQVLTGLGVEVDEAANGVEALDKLREAEVDVVFTDIVMPQMDGFELCQEIRADPKLAHLLVVLVSTHYDAHYIIRGLRLGADDYVPKPVEPELVARVLTRIQTPLAGGSA